jgi:hypothetical protein
LAPPCFGPRNAPIAPVIAGDVGARTGDYARGERRGIEPVLRVEDERGMHCVTHSGFGAVP